MDQKFITKLNGREFVQYGGLLDEAHRQGLKVIKTAIAQVPSADNDFTAICTAEVVLERDGEHLTFTGIGDASPKNVNRNIAPHVLRISETRAKARALRDAINVGMCSVEELGPNGELPEGYDPQAHQAPGATASRTTPKALAGISDAQLDESEREMKRVGWTADLGRAYLRRHFKKEARSQLTQDEAQKLIDHLKTLPDATVASGELARA
jgi:hypothetical protein